MLTETFRKISAFVRGGIYVLRTMIGIRPTFAGQLDYAAPASALWLFLIGVPVGMLFFGSQAFPVGIWALIVLSILILMNIDDAATLTINFFKYGVDGVVEDKNQEKTECGTI